MYIATADHRSPYPLRTYSRDHDGHVELVVSLFLHLAPGECVQRQDSPLDQTLYLSFSGAAIADRDRFVLHVILSSLYIDVQRSPDHQFQLCCKTQADTAPTRTHLH